MTRTVAAAVLALAVAGSSGWEARAPIPLARSEAAAAAVGGEIAVAGGFVESGQSSARVDLYSPAGDRWRRAPDLPLAINHAMAAASGGRLYVVGGYTAVRGPSRAAFVLVGGAWRRLAPLPFARAAGGAAVAGGRLYVVGGVGPAGLARNALALDLGSGRWSVLPGPTPREHLAVAALAGRIYAIAGRTAGFDTNLTVVESYARGEGAWRRDPPVPEPRGGTGAAVAAGAIVSVGGEAPEGTIRSVYAFRPAARSWTRLPDLPTPRHGAGVAALDPRVYVISGGTVPGLSVSAANETLDVS